MTHLKSFVETVEWEKKCSCKNACSKKTLKRWLSALKWDPLKIDRRGLSSISAYLMGKYLKKCISFFFCLHYANGQNFYLRIMITFCLLLFFFISIIPILSIVFDLFYNWRNIKLVPLRYIFFSFFTMPYQFLRKDYILMARSLMISINFF